jgi:enediyne biosynthesis protein E4
MASTKPHRGKSSPEIETEERDDLVIRKAMIWSVLVIAVAAVIGGVVYWQRPKPEAPEVVKVQPSAPAKVRTILATPKFQFTDITRQAGIRFVHENGATGEKLLPETMGGGCAFLDFDSDGDADLLFVNSTYWTKKEQPDSPRPTMALYENDGTGKFTDVTAGSGLDVSFYGQGVAVGDYDNDGRVDLYITAVGSNRLFHNLGKGKFLDVTNRAGVAGESSAWGTSCGWFDYDRDGDLDLFVCNYVQWSAEFDRRQKFTFVGGKRGYGRPQVFPGTYPVLYRNEGQGRFTDVSLAAKIRIKDKEGEPLAKSLGVTFCDFDGDGYLDVFVANDTAHNLLFRNLGNGEFGEIGEHCKIAEDKLGNTRGAMGIHVARFRNSDAFGVLIGNYANEETALYVTQNKLGQTLKFDDDAVSNGLGPLTEHDLTFGLFFFDCDLDGRLDILTANGHLDRDIQISDKTQSYQQSPQLLWNAGPKQDTEFLPVTASFPPFQEKDESAEDFKKRLVTHAKQTRDFQTRMGDLVKPMVGRGSSYADIDGDGDLDVVLVGNGQPARLLRNDQKFGHHWLRVKLQGTTSNRDAIGSWVTIKLKNGTILRQQVMPTASYLSQVELPLTFGLGKSAEIESLEVTWPNGKTTKQTVEKTDRQITLTEPK